MGDKKKPGKMSHVHKSLSKGSSLAFIVWGASYTASGEYAVMAMICILFGSIGFFLYSWL